VSYALSGKDNKTTLTIRQEGIESEMEKEHSEKNRKDVLEGLKKLLEKENVSA
jgi:hypothetical protein